MSTISPVPAISPGGVSDRMLASGAPVAGAEVMGTGIVSVALSLAGEETISRVLLVIAAVLWVLLGVAVPAGAAHHPARFRAEVRTPPVLSWVAATAVLGARLALLGWTRVSVALLGVAVILWVLLIGPVVRHWRTPTRGASLLLTVATQSLAVLAATIALRTRTTWLEFAALVPFGLGLASYPFVMARFDLRELTAGRGDQWITGGALAISTLAAGNIAAAARARAVLGHGHGAFEVMCVALWVGSMLWLPALVLAEVLRPRLEYDSRRWSTVFPVGMYAACSFVVGDVSRAGAITGFGRVWVWVALAVWAVVFGAMVGAKTVRTRTE